MEKKGKVLVVVFFILAVNAFAETAFDYIRQSLANIVTIGSLMQLTDYEYNGVNALKGVWLEKGKKISLSTDYTSGVEYFIMATSDDTDLDIDLRLNRDNQDGVLIASDSDDDGTPIITFTPSSSGKYTYTVTNYSDESAFVSVIVLRQKRNARFSLTPILEALQNILTYGEVSYLLLNFPLNEWILFGGSVNEGDTTGIYNMRLPQGTYFLMGAGDSSVNDCDVSVVRQTTAGSPEGSTIAEDEEVESFGMAGFQATGSNYYNLKIKNYDSRNSSGFVFGFLLKS